MTKPVILTGLRANNDLHIGNYFGAMLPLIEMAIQRSDDYQINMFIPDLHSFTTPINHDELYDQILHNARLYAAAGLPLDNASIHLYRQSHVPAHSELTWILDCFTGFGEMHRMTQFKDKANTTINFKNIDAFREKMTNIKEKMEKAKEAADQLNDAANSTDDYETKLKLSEEAIEKNGEVLELNTIFMDQVVGILQEESKIKEKEEGTKIGLFNYPVLMACDILLYDATYVPVGDDQKQHLEFTRDIAERMNKKFGDVFTVPEPVAKQHEFFGKGQGLRIKDLVDPTKKMSKSDETGKGVIFLGDDPELAAKKIMSATTDDKAYVRLDRENQPGVSNLLEILALLRGATLDDVVREFEGTERYGDFKKVVAGEMKQFLINFQDKLANVRDEDIFAKLESSEKAMNEQANATLLRTQQVVGLRPKAN